MRLVSYAQNFEDIRLWRAYSDVGEGRYLDIGAQDPVRDSVSLFFYKRGWRGVHVEPTPAYAAAMRAARPDEPVIEAAVSASPVPMRLFEFPNTGLSTGASDIAESHKDAGWPCREITVPTVTLASLFEYMGQDLIHWLKIDVEGMEADVLSSWGEHPARPAALVIEATAPNTQILTHHAWYDMVVARGYAEVLFDGLSRYFVHESHAHRRDALALSPNVFDGFQITAAHFAAIDLVAETEASIAANRDRARAECEKDTARAAEELALALTQADVDRTAASSMAEAMRVELENANARLTNASVEVARSKDELAKQALLFADTQLIASERFISHDRELADANERFAALQFEHNALSRDAGRLEGQLVADATSHAARLCDERAARNDLANRLGRAERELAVWRTKESGFRAELKLQAHQHETALAASAAAFERNLANVRSDAACLENEKAGLAEQLSNMLGKSNGLDEQMQALQAEIERLHSHITWREKQLQQAADLLEAMPDPLAWFPRLLTALVRQMGGKARMANFAEYRAAVGDWRNDYLGLSTPTMSDKTQLSIDCNTLVAHAALINGDLEMMGGDNPITSVPRLLAPHDREFIHAAYQSVLGRAPDHEGEVYYLNRLRAGEHKLAILRQLRRSPEGRAFIPDVAGLDRAIKRHRRATLPVVGAVVRMLTGAEGNSATHRHLRILANEIGRMNDSNAALLHSVRQWVEFPRSQIDDGCKKKDAPSAISGTPRASLVEQQTSRTAADIVIPPAGVANGNQNHLMTVEEILEVFA